MIKSKTIKLFLILSIILLSLISVGCNNLQNDLTISDEKLAIIDEEPLVNDEKLAIIDKEPPINDEDLSDDCYKKTGPCILPVEFIFRSNSDFLEFVKRFNTQGKAFVSFDFDNLQDIYDNTFVSEKYYYLNAILPMEKNEYSATDADALFDYFVKYIFNSLDYPPGWFGVDRPSFKIMCFYRVTYDHIDLENIDFEFQSLEGHTYNYKLMSDGSEIMEIAISTRDSAFVVDLLTLLKDSIVILK